MKHYDSPLNKIDTLLRTINSKHKFNFQMVLIHGSCVQVLSHATLRVNVYILLFLESHVHRLFQYFIYWYLRYFVYPKRFINSLCGTNIFKHKFTSFHFRTQSTLEIFNTGEIHLNALASLFCEAWSSIYFSY